MKNIRFICERCGKKSKRLKRIVDKKPITGRICWECLVEEEKKKEAKANLTMLKKREKLQKSCKHNWYVLGLGGEDGDVLLCSKCEKRIYP